MNFARPSLEKFSDELLVRECLAGNDDAWRTLITRYQTFLLRLPLRFGLCPADAEDVFQNVCLKLCLHLQEIEDPKRLAGWLSTVTRQECLRLLRRRPSESLTEIVEETLLLDAKERGPETIVIEEERLQALRRSLAELPPKCQSLLTRLYGPEPMAYTQAAAELGLPLGSIGPQRARCLEYLRKKMRAFR